MGNCVLARHQVERQHRREAETEEERFRHYVIADHVSWSCFAPSVPAERRIEYRLGTLRQNRVLVTGVGRWTTVEGLMAKVAVRAETTKRRSLGAAQVVERRLGQGTVTERSTLDSGTAPRRE
jgi:hypothetical protein